MATETLTIYLTDDQDKISGKNLVDDENDTQIVTILDGGSDLGDEGPYVFEFWGKDDANNAGESIGGDDVFKIDLAGFNDTFSIEVKSMDPGDQFWISNYDTWTTVGFVHTFTYTGWDGGTYTLTIDAESTNWGDPYVASVMCFTDTAWIDTPTGPRQITGLQAGDQVLCADGQARPIRWIGSRSLSVDDLVENPDLAPIEIPAGAIAPGAPSRDMQLSPQHRVLFDDWRVELMFGLSEVLIPAKALTELPGVAQAAPAQGVTYYHILLDTHQVISANGLACETLMPAEVAHSGLTTEARSEILKLFPELVSDFGAYGDLCHTALTVSEGRVYLSGFSCAAA